ncbi:hypothetical protein LWI29_012085 [Acer saccharum]|uniref:Transposase MuDR plant domain-containing protein n=1 Tax=Acer saccharum TaxID=4024 RepID=A0AA39VC26_ACESA|nr:hypothetical protein LWI29_012085 [Acer saccharum]
MKKELGVYAMENHFRYRVTRSTTTQYEASCTDFNCQWLVCAVKKRQATHWFTKKPFRDFCGDCYKTTSWVEAYSNHVDRTGAGNVEKKATIHKNVH